MPRTFPRWMHSVAFVIGVENLGKPGDYLAFFQSVRRNLTGKGAPMTDR